MQGEGGGWDDRHARPAGLERQHCGHCVQVRAVLRCAAPCCGGPPSGPNSLLGLHMHGCMDLQGRTGPRLEVSDGGSTHTHAASGAHLPPPLLTILQGHGASAENAWTDLKSWRVAYSPEPRWSGRRISVHVGFLSGAWLAWQQRLGRGGACRGAHAGRRTGTRTSCRPTITRAVQGEGGGVPASIARACFHTIAPHKSSVPLQRRSSPPHPLPSLAPRRLQRSGAGQGGRAGRTQRHPPSHLGDRRGGAVRERGGAQARARPPYAICRCHALFCTPGGRASHGTTAVPRTQPPQSAAASATCLPPSLPPSLHLRPFAGRRARGAGQPAAEPGAPGIQNHLLHLWLPPRGQQSLRLPV